MSGLWQGSAVLGLAIHERESDGEALGTDLESFPSSLPAPDYPVGVIAGLPGGGLGLDVIPEDSDGLVPVESTKVEGMATRIGWSMAATLIASATDGPDYRDLEELLPDFSSCLCVGSHLQEFHFPLSGQTHIGSSSKPWPTTLVWPNSFSNPIELQSSEFSREEMRRVACETTHTCVDFDALTINLASAGNKSGWRLVSGSFNTIKGGGLARISHKGVE